MEEFEYRGDTAWGKPWKAAHRRDGRCSNCGGKRKKGRGYYCRPCMAAYMRAYRAKAPAGKVEG